MKTNGVKKKYLETLGFIEKSLFRDDVNIDILNDLIIQIKITFMKISHCLFNH